MRRPDIHLLKVDRAPAGEHVLLPEGAETPALSTKAAQRLESLTLSTPPKPVAKDGEAPGSVPITARPAQAGTQSDSTTAAQASSNAPIVSSRQAPVIRPAQKRVSSPGPNIHTHAAAAAKTKTKISVPTPTLETQIDQTDHAPPPSVTAIKRNQWLPYAIGLAGAATLGSGYYLFEQSQALFSALRSRVQASQARQQEVPSTTLIQSAIREPEPPAQPAVVSTQADVIQNSAAAPTSRTAPAEPPTPVSESTVPSVAKPSITPMKVQVIAKDVKLRAGPGTHFPVLRIVPSREIFDVIQWNDQWFHVQSRSHSARSASGPDVGWIRNDLVARLSE